MSYEVVQQLREQHAASQLREKKLREALEELMTCKQGEFCDHYPAAYKKARQALSQPTNDTPALDAAVKYLTRDVSDPQQDEGGFAP
jgi:hypothetical protein